MGKLDVEFPVLDEKLVFNLYRTNRSRPVSAVNFQKRLGLRISKFIISDGNPSDELQGNPSCNMNSAIRLQL